MRGYKRVRALHIDGTTVQGTGFVSRNFCVKIGRYSMAKKYRIKLSEQERSNLNDIVKKGEVPVHDGGVAAKPAETLLVDSP